MGVEYRPYEPNAVPQDPASLSPTPAPQPRRVTFVNTWLLPLLFMLLHMFILNMVGVGYMTWSLIGSGEVPTDPTDLLLSVDLVEMQTVASIIGSLILIPIYYFYMRNRYRSDARTLLNEPRTNKKALYTLLFTFIGLSLSHLLIIGMDALSGTWDYLAIKLQEYEELSQLLAGASNHWFWNLLGTVILVPIAEEMLFRGILMGAFLPAMKPGWAITASSILFALFHMNFVQTAYVMILAFILGYVYWRTRNFFYPVLLHMAYNFFGGFFPTIIGTDKSEKVSLYYMVAIGVVAAISVVLLSVNRVKEKRARAIE